jgi:hypothetical protein
VYLKIGTPLGLPFYLQSALGSVFLLACYLLGVQKKRNAGVVYVSKGLKLSGESGDRGDSPFQAWNLCNY